MKAKNVLGEKIDLVFIKIYFYLKKKYYNVNFEIALDVQITGRLC